MVPYSCDIRETQTERLLAILFPGHSNGGQGAWYLGTHFPDKAVAIFAAAGYTKIQDYVPYGNWLSVSHSDPWLRGVCLLSSVYLFTWKRIKINVEGPYQILESSIAEYNNDLHTSNLVRLVVFSIFLAALSNKE